jgi:hypothetical protein
VARPVTFGELYATLYRNLRRFGSKPRSGQIETVVAVEIR